MKINCRNCGGPLTRHFMLCVFCDSINPCFGWSDTVDKIVNATKPGPLLTKSYNNLESFINTNQLLVAGCAIMTLSMMRK